MGKVSTLTNLPLEPGCEDYSVFFSFLDQEVADFEHGLDSILTDAVEVEEMGTSFNECDVMT